MKQRTPLQSSIIVLALLTALSSAVQASSPSRSALNVPVPGNLDSRIVTFAYTPDVVYRLAVTVGMHTHIMLGADEELIEVPRIGDKVRWRIEGNEKNLYIKATAAGTNTSLSLVTSKRVYQFELVSTERASERVQKAMFSYPDAEEQIQLRARSAENADRAAAQLQADNLRAQNISPEPIDPADLRFLNIKANDPAFNVMHAYTDGIRTYIRMPPSIQDLPAVFMVELNENEKETLMPVNYTVLDRKTARDRDVIVIDRLSPVWVLQIGTKAQVRITD